MVNAVATTTDINLLKNQASSLGASSAVLQAIKNASDKTGVDFSYLLKKACQESSFNPTAQASTSSAKGLYQFTSQTWLRMVKSEGSQHGLGQYADHIHIDKNGIAKVDSPAWKQAILNLRNDPSLSATMAAELDKKNLSAIKNEVGGKIGGTELYLAHFLGASGACDFLNTMKSEPNTAAADVLPNAAAANGSVFYNADGSARSLKEIYQIFARKFTGTGSVTATASNTSTPQTQVAAQNALATYGNRGMISATQGQSQITVASSIDTLGTQSTTSSYAPVSLSGIHSTTSSLYATMVLAQMNSEGIGSLSSLNHTDSNSKDNTKNDEKKQNLMSLLGLVG